MRANQPHLTEIDAATNGNLYSKYNVWPSESVKITFIWEYWSTMYTIKNYLRHENKVNENKVCYASHKYRIIYLYIWIVMSLCFEDQA